MADRLDELLVRAQPVEVWGALEELADPEVLAEMLAEWRPGDEVVSRCIERVALLSGRETELPSGLAGEAERVRRREAELMEGLVRGESINALADADDELDFALDLRCTECGRTHSYAVERVTIHPELDKAAAGWDGYVLGRIVTCKTCGAVDRHELSFEARMRQNAKLMASLGAGRGLSHRIRVGVPALRWHADDPRLSGHPPPGGAGCAHARRRKKKQ